MKTTFKSYCFTTLLEEKTDLPIYKFAINKKLIGGFAKKVEFCKEGLLIQTNPYVAIGFKEDILRAFKREGFSVKEIDANLELASDYVASKYVAQRKKKEICIFIEKKMHKLRRPLVYGIKIGKSNTQIIGQNVFIIHKKTDDPLDLEFSGGGAKRLSQNDAWKMLKDKHGFQNDDENFERKMSAYYNAQDEWSKLDDFLFIVPEDRSKFNPQTDQNCQWLRSHLHEITTETQIKNGTFAFHLPAPRRETLIITSTGYVRVDPLSTNSYGMPSPTTTLSKPVGENSSEIMKNAFEHAVRWVKKNL